MKMGELDTMVEENAYVDTKVYDLRQAAMTKRCHTVPTIGSQTVGEHSYHVAMLVMELTAGQPSLALVKAALYHDLAETATGDVPATTKWRSPMLKHKLDIMETVFNNRHGLSVHLSTEEALILKWADALELGFYCTDQLMYGNKHVKEMYHNILKFTQTLDVPLGLTNTISNIVQRLVTSYERATSN